MAGTGTIEPELASSAVCGQPLFAGPAQIGPYRLLDVLGEGGMGRVFRAEHGVTGALVALKTVNRATRQRMLALREEVAALRAVTHPGLVTILDQGNHQGVPWYAMELLTGKTLANYNDHLWDSGLEVTRSGVSRATRPPPGELQREAWDALSQPTAAPRVPVAGGALAAALRLYLQLCAPLAHIHARGMVHRDLKPQNVFIRTDDTPVLMDFGLIGYASGAIGRELLDAGNQGFGTVHYAAPERIEGRQVDARADLYSLGCMLYETLLGRPPFIGEAGHVLAQHVGAAPLAPSELATGVPAAIEELLLSLLAKSPQKRIGHASDVAARIAAALGERSAVVSGDSVPLFRPKLSGRDEILRQLAEQLRRAQVKNGGLVLLAGESGIGKTFLTSELAYGALEQGFRVVTGGATPLVADAAEHAQPSAGPFHGLRRLLQTIADACLELGPEERQRVLGERAAYLAPFEPSLEAFVMPGHAADALPGVAGSERVISAFAETLRSYVGNTPLLLMVDDLQWADPLTISLLESLDAKFFTGLPLLVVGAYRSDQTTAALEALRSSASCTTLALGRLGEADVRRMITDMLSSEPPDHLVSFLLNESEGNPFFVAEYLRYLVTSNHLERQNGRWVLVGERTGLGTDYASLTMPGKLAELLARRLDALSAEAQAVVHAAAVLGRAFALDVLARMLGLAEETLLGLLAEARERQVIEAVTLNRYRFVHDKLREASYSALTDAALRQLHGDAARAIEASPAEEAIAISHAAELAGHHRIAGDLRKAMAYFGQAGVEALHKSAVHEAISHLRAALEIERAIAHSDSTRSATWQRLLGGALHDIGEFHAGNGHLERALELLGERAPPKSTPLQIGLVLAELGRQTVHRLAPGARRSRRDPQRTLDCALIYDRLQQAAYYTGEVLPMLHTCLRTLNLAEQAPPSPTLTIAYTNAHAVAGVMPLPKLAARYEQLARSSMQAAPSVVARAYFQMLSGVYLTGIGEWERALASLWHGLELSEQVDFAQRAREIVGATSIAQFLWGHYREARNGAEQVLAMSTPKYAHTFCWGLLSRAQAALLQGDGDGAVRDLDECDQRLQGLGRPVRIWSTSLRAYAAAKSGDRASADRISRDATEEIAAAPTVTHFTLDAVARCVEVRIWLATSGTEAQDKRHLSRALAGLRAVRRAFPVAEPRALLMQGYWLRQSGQRERARRSFELSLTCARKLRMRYDEARAVLALSEDAGTGGERAMATQLLHELDADLAVARLL
ncbi:MAG TPA: protein kinase [Polyangiaceae bacterium]|nr:protein kinase [Polyangiaceae bacterium]